jgi:hypothetical protein
MNPIHEFKARLLNKLFAAWSNYCFADDHGQIEEKARNEMIIQKSLELWADYLKLEARLE